MVEPPAPEFHTCLRHVGLQGVKIGKCPIRTGSEVERFVDVRQSSARNHIGTRAVRRKQRNVYAAVAHECFDCLQIGFVIAVRAVLVLHLHGKNIAALGNLQRDQFLHRATIIIAYAPHKIGVVATNAQVFILEQPSRKTAEIPFAARIRPRTNDDPQAELLRRFTELRDVEHAFEAEFTFLGLVHVPTHDRFDRIESCRLQFAQAVFPIFGHDTEIVHGTRIQAERFPVEIKAVFFDFKHRFPSQIFSI